MKMGMGKNNIFGHFHNIFGQIWQHKNNIFGLQKQHFYPSPNYHLGDHLVYLIFTIKKYVYWLRKKSQGWRDIIEKITFPQVIVHS